MHILLTVTRFQFVGKTLRKNDTINKIIAPTISLLYVAEIKENCRIETTCKKLKQFGLNVTVPLLPPNQTAAKEDLLADVAARLEGCADCFGAGAGT